MRLSSLIPFLAVAAAAPSEKRLAPINTGYGNIMPDHYIVKLFDGSAVRGASSAMALLDEEPSHVYERVMRGFAAKISPETLEKLRAHSDVEYIDHDGWGEAAVEPGWNETQPVSLGEAVDKKTQADAPWGLGRISAKSPGAKDYVYDSSAGEGTCSYILDSGVDTKHEDFEGRASVGKTFVGSAGDRLGHGTHCAGSVGGKISGVAKKTKIIDVKIISDNNSVQWAHLISAMEFVVGDSTSCPKGKFVNLSIQGGPNKSANDACTKASKDGVFVGTAAGNASKDAAQSSPGSADEVCNTGATDDKDAKASFSNFGAKLAIWGPGVGIMSCKPGGGMTGMSGTSMAAPHIVGLAATLASKDGGKGFELCKKIVSMAHQGLVKNPGGGSPNVLAYNGMA
ncbi:hypothetical protein VHEMI03044 [[Torrubiella] hemipterigena]|uniref:Uncharacterized protein n=1 Tax=[Torrubiella] hemipterigena TaxID=1531966 RepID=A0A0A1T9Y1_9HYPO|nr:hypothetical protein VHEMI03044 [[Torrubiella] hemipterigena]